MRLITFLMPFLASIPATLAFRAVNMDNAAVATSAFPTPTLTLSGIAETISSSSLLRNLEVRDSSSASASTSTTSTASSTSTCHPTIAPDKNGYVPPWECDAMYEYYPSFKAAAAFTALFGIVLTVHLAQALAYRTTFAWVVIMGVGWEFGGYLTRAFSTKNQQSSGLATTTQLLVLLAPLWVNAFDYMVLARMIWYFLPEKRIWIFKPSLLAIIFVCLDFCSFLVQAAGGLMASPGASLSTIKTGLHIYMGGIGIQQFFICCFLVLAVQFHRQMLVLEKTGQLAGEKIKWKELLYSLYFSLVAITVRIIYRLIEYTSGVGLNNPITTHEWYMYVFDAVPMLFATAVWCVLHPGRILRGPDAKLPPSGLGYILSCAHCCHGCACCCRGGARKARKSKKSKRGMEALPSTNGSQEDVHLTAVENWYDGPGTIDNGRQPADIGYEPYRSRV